jgi:hypothetical protein
MKHPTENQLNEYLDGFLAPSVQAGMQTHLLDCEDCQARLARLQTVFQALAALPELAPERNLTTSVMYNLPRVGIGLGWWLVLAIQAGMSLGLLLLSMPFIPTFIPRIMLGWTGRWVVPEVRFPNPVDFHFNPLVLPVPHLPNLALPVRITHANYSVWLILGIAAGLLFIVGNLCLIFNGTSRPGK